MTRIVCLVVLVLGTTVVFSQEATDPVAEAPAAEIPVQVVQYDNGDRLLVRSLAQLAGQATAECQALASVKVYTELKAQVIEHIEAKYPGQTVHPDTGLLIEREE